jgi:hypothetical protein
VASAPTTPGGLGVDPPAGMERHIGALYAREATVPLRGSQRERRI